MDYYYNLQLLDSLSSSIDIVLAFIILFKVPSKAIKLSLFICVIATALWHISLPDIQENAMLHSLLLFAIECLRYLSWSLALSYLIMQTRKEKLPAIWHINLYASLFLASALLIYALTSTTLILLTGSIWFYIKITLCLFNIVLCEQLVRSEDSSRMAKLVALITGTLFAYDIFLFSSLFLFGYTDNDIWYARGIINSSTTLMLALSIIFYAPQLKEKGHFKLSNSVILFNTSLTLVGIFLVLIALFGATLNYFALDWLNATSIMIYVMAILAIITLSFSEQFRKQIVVFTSKHFFSQKYDYRKQWQKLDAILGTDSNTSNSYEKSLQAMLTLFACNGAAIWIKGQQFYSLVAAKNIPLPSESPIENNLSEFISMLQAKDWVFKLSQPDMLVDQKINSLAPEWLTDIEHAWVVIPLNTGDQLVGFALLAKNQLSEPLTWEDLDLMKLTGGQIASYISHQQAAEQLQHNKQFALFNKITAFAIHDVKNLIAQQALVVKNAEKFKHEPEFIDDAINTIAASVEKMDKLLLKLQGQVNVIDETINLGQLAREAVAMNSHTRPVPKIMINAHSAEIVADRDKLLMVLNHLIKNAQEASRTTDTITVTIDSDDAGIWVIVEDTGTGMDENFVKNRLFQPFSSTKINQGMGIGAYQIRELTHSLRGELLVESRPDVGSKFSIYLPKTINCNMQVAT